FVYQAGHEKPVVDSFVRLVTREIPTAFRRERMAIAIAAAAFIFGALFGAAAVLVDRANGTRLIPGDFFTESPRERVARIEHDDERIDSAEKAMFFGASLFTHNIQVSFLAFSLGALTYVGALWLLFYNGVILGAIATMCILEGGFSQFSAKTIPYPAKISVAVLLFSALMTYLFVERRAGVSPAGSQASSPARRRDAANPAAVDGGATRER